LTTRPKIVSATLEDPMTSPFVTAHPGLAALRNGIDGAAVIAVADGGRGWVENGLDTVTGAPGLTAG
jgi:hypothetical protein